MKAEDWKQDARAHEVGATVFFLGGVMRPAGIAAKVGGMVEFAGLTSTEEDTMA